MKELLSSLASSPTVVLMRKEFAQIARDRRLRISLILPPVVQLMLFGFALNSTVSHLRLGITDLSQTPTSRELISNMTQSGSFALGGSYLSAEQMGAAIGRDELDAGVVIPVDFERDLQRGRPVEVQVLLNAMNANNAALGQGYAEGVVGTWSRSYVQNGSFHVQFRKVGAAKQNIRSLINLRPAFLYNPGLITRWYVVTGTFGLLLILNGSLIASASMIKERERGTVEQLLMTPASPGQIIIAKIAPLFILLLGMLTFATVILKVIFDIPFRGNIAVMLAGAALCVLCGIGIGTFIATFTKTAQQAQMAAFFVNPPLSSLSGALTPVEAMPAWVQPLTLFNPVRHFSLIARGTLIKGAGLNELWPNLLALAGFTIVMLTLSMLRFRKQLA
jgi:ABC-2 type transport system permease protein